jgi:uncharacterized protein (DUF1330 family)
LSKWATPLQGNLSSKIGLRHKSDKLLVVEETPTLLEGEWPYTRTVMIRFSDENEAKRWYQSDQYQALAQYRFRASRSNLILAKGCS